MGYRFAFYTSSKARTINFAEMLSRGASAHGDRIELIDQKYFGPDQLKVFDGGANLGLARACKRLFDSYLDANKHFLFFDKGYTKEGFWRVSVDAWQPLAYFQRFMRPGDRFAKSGMRLNKRRKRDGNTVVLFAGACQNYSNFFELGNVNEYNLGVLRELRKHTERKIIYRPNPSWYNKHYDEFQPIHELVENVELSEPTIIFSNELERTHLLVTHGSSASVGALATGVPIMVLGGGIARSMALTEDEIDRVENIHWPKEETRQQFFNDLSYCQWTANELTNGKAWEEIRLALMALEGTGTGDPITQYQMMHAHPNYFRGLTTLKYVKEIGAVIARTHSQRILDYGCGKGEQYLPPYSLDILWGLHQVIKYDPGVPQFSKVPSNPVEGVICCDVMEHVPEDKVLATLTQIISLAERFVFFAIATCPAKKFLPDGRNCHLTVQPRTWWEERIKQAKAAVGRGQEIVLVTDDGDE